MSSSFINSFSAGHLFSRAHIFIYLWSAQATQFNTKVCVFVIKSCCCCFFFCGGAASAASCHLIRVLAAGCWCPHLPIPSHLFLLLGLRVSCVCSRCYQLIIQLSGIMKIKINLFIYSRFHLVLYCIIYTPLSLCCCWPSPVLSVKRFNEGDDHDEEEEEVEEGAFFLLHLHLRTYLLARW